jgi:D-glucosaminate-6-phosphate ammonia-lyase
MWAALDLYVKRDHAADWKEWEKRVQTIADLVAAAPGIQTEPFVPPIANHVPHLRIRWDIKTSGLSPAEVGKRLRAGEPAIEVQVVEDAIIAGVWMLEPGQDQVVGQRLRDILKSV